VPYYLECGDWEPWSVLDYGEWQGFDILGFGYAEIAMGGAGTRPDLGPLPEWTARYIMCGTADRRAETLGYGDLAASWSGDYTSADPTKMITTDDDPLYWLDERGLEGHIPLSPLGTPALDTAHKPSFAYVPYLVTGRRFYADEMAFHANYAIMSTPYWTQPFTREHGELLWQQSLRGIAWALRDVADAAAYLPDASPYRAYYSRVVTANLEALDDCSKTAASPLGFVSFATWYDEPYVKEPLWMAAFLIWSLEHARVQTGATAGVAIRDLMAQNLVDFINSPEGMPGVYAVWDYIIYGTWEPETDTITYFTTWQEVFEANFVREDGTIEPEPYWPGYGHHFWMALTVAKQVGIEGAAEALEVTRGMDQQGYPGWFMESLIDSSAYAFADPDDTPAAPADTIFELLRQVIAIIVELIQRLLAVLT
jgi:hypothetical protein